MKGGNVVELFSIKGGAKPAPEKKPELPTDELTLQQAADYATSKGRKLSRKTLYNLINEGLGPRREKEGGRWYIKRSDMDAWLKHRRELKQAFTK